MSLLSGDRRGPARPWSQTSNCRKRLTPDEQRKCKRRRFIVTAGANLAQAESPILCGDELPSFPLKPAHSLDLWITAPMVSFAPPTALSTLPLSLSTAPSASIFLSPIDLPTASPTVPFA